MDIGKFFYFYTLVIFADIKLRHRGDPLGWKLSFVPLTSVIGLLRRIRDFSRYHQPHSQPRCGDLRAEIFA